MKILYISNACVPKTYNQLFKNAKQKSSEAVQKYHRIMAEGFALDKKNEVTHITILPVSSSHAKSIITKKSETYHGVKYVYCPCVNIRFLKNIINGLYVLGYIMKESLFHKNSCIVCDTLSVTGAVAAIFGGRICHTKTAGIVTDLPEFFEGNSERNLKISDFIFQHLDSYVLLTEQMNLRLNKRNIPYVVIEGQVDLREKKSIQTVEQDSGKTSKKICMYAGTIQRQYGLADLVEGFRDAKLDNWELHLYGNGEYVEDLEEICRKNENIRHFDSMPNEKIVELEKDADLLVNPRPTLEEYTKYSFPSKNMEYMVSGTPVLTTKLPGMPEEYKQYVYLIEDESRQGICKAFQMVAKRDKTELETMGSSAKAFVLKKKNNAKQARKIKLMIQQMLRG